MIGISSFVGTQFTSWNFFAWITRTWGKVANRDRLQNQDEEGERKPSRGAYLYATTALLHCGQVYSSPSSPVRMSRQSASKTSL